MTTLRQAGPTTWLTRPQVCLQALTPNSQHLASTYYVPRTLLRALRTLYLETSPNSPIIVHVLLTRALPNITPKTAESSQRQACLAPKSLL